MLSKRNMLNILLLRALIISSITSALVVSQAEAVEACWFTDMNYRNRRNDNGEYIEGIQRAQTSGATRLIGLSTRRIFELGSELSISIPRNSVVDRAPVRIISPRNDYRFDTFLTGNFNRFRWSTCVLRRADIQPRELYAVSYSNNIYIPVTIGQPGSHYEISFWSYSSVRFNKFKIILNGEPVYTTSTNSFRNGAVTFEWDGRNSPAGQYEIEYEIENHRGNRYPLGKYSFRHNPNWLR